jgi:hypothetical protein
MSSYISSINKQFKYYKLIAEKAIHQLDDNQLFISLNGNLPSKYSTSIAIIMKHMSGNMLSRWTNVFEEDGEKPWRERENEFVLGAETREFLMERWEAGWDCLFQVTEHIQESDLEREIFIRNMGQTLTDALNRQLMHYGYHIGQIVLIAKELKGDLWQSLSIPLGESNRYNNEKFNAEKTSQHFTDEFLKNK